MATYEMKFMFDWGSGTCVWGVNDAAHKRYDYPVDLAELPISPDLLKRLQDLVKSTTFANRRMARRSRNRGSRTRR